MPLRKLLRNLMEGKERDITYTELAAAIKSDPSTVSNYFNYETDFKFDNLLISVRFLTQLRGLNEEDVMNVVIDELVKTEKRQCIRFSMEYLSTSGNLTKLKEVIDSQMFAPKENRDWAEAYKLAYLYQIDELSGDSLLDALDEYRPKYLETKIFKEFLKLYAHTEKLNYQEFMKTTKKIEKMILSIKDKNTFIKESYLARLHELLANAYLYEKNDTKKARFYANNVINSPLLCASFKFNSYYIMGMSFLFEDYEECVKYLETYIEQLKQYGKTRVGERIKYIKENDICFARIFWGKDLDKLNTNDILERAHYECRYGDKLKAIKLLDDYDDKKDPFYLYYKGLATDDPRLLTESMMLFVKQGKKFFANLPKNELEKNPIYKDLISVIFEIA
jgi:hypothetical protein